MSIEINNHNVDINSTLISILFSQNNHMKFFSLEPNEGRRSKHSNHSREREDNISIVQLSRYHNKRRQLLFKAGCQQHRAMVSKNLGALDVSKGIGHALMSGTGGLSEGP